MDIKNIAISTKIVIESLVCLLENENVDLSSIKFKVGSASEGYESPDMEFGKLIDIALDGLEELKENPTKAPEGFVLVPKGSKYFSHDFNGDGFQYHDTLQEAKKAAEADLDIYRDRVADGNHIADMGEFNELAYGIVVGQAEWSIDCVVNDNDHKEGEYTQYEIGTEILSLYLSEAQEQSHE